MTNEATTTKAPRLKAIRHHKQRFDPQAEFIWRKRFRMGDDPEQPFVFAGDRVDKSALRPGRLKRFWAAGVIELANWTPPGKRRPGADALLCVGRPSPAVYMLSLKDPSGVTHDYRCRGLGNLLLRADALSIRSRVEALVSTLKSDKALRAAAEDGFIVATEDDEGGSTDGDVKDSSSEVDSGEGDAAPDGGGALREVGVPADSPATASGMPDFESQPCGYNDSLATDE